MKEMTVSEMGRLGGKAGTGASKVRGGSDYYRRIRAIQEEKKKNKKPTIPKVIVGVRKVKQ